ncbi:Ppx/GppA family phosphatase [Alteriqipengyuania lutimaris]|uniref:Ppx/GppA family phosphatase n=1 Tax=Alteriqipengyuania lutimaris TaxID=1538146 RepID=A0A395LN34_9SPHN|nr:Ppx/GppA family phosphatase [Alteriqipengyuania lutimaris]MBB3033122.1 exopolyphosphatase/guanosine-5'-triphosphate,3'-diphosphate pyrophosphatase [Alteriqipengyuania lutimaris]RDS77817.1 Ppx/GppA family phosphatase [Alteriqipengyuania lutimaris]
MGRKNKHDRGRIAGSYPHGAIIDIGSNTVRLVIYGGPPRAPAVLFNEKVTARLGRDLDKNGLLADEAVDLAMVGLERFALILADLDVERVDTVATAAVRDAENGENFLARVRSLGLEPRLLSGLDEATVSAEGVLGAFPRASGIVADIGGGSLELVPVDGGTVGDGCSLPAGTLRLPSLGGGDTDKLRDKLKKMVGKNAPAMVEGGDLYLVGGTWRAMAGFARAQIDYPLTDPHGFTMTRDEAAALAKTLAKTDVETIKAIPRVSSSRADSLPLASHLLHVLLKHYDPERIVISAWGLREGLMMRRIDRHRLAQDPLLAGTMDFAESRGVSPLQATRVAGWTVDTVSSRRPGAERLRFAAILLGMAAMQTEPNLRVDQGVDWALHKRWIAISPEGRAMLAAAIQANSNELDLPESLTTLASEAALAEAISWGLSLRLARRLGAGSARSLEATRLTREDGALVLTLAKSHAALYGPSAQRDLALLADHLGLEPKMKVKGEKKLPEMGEAALSLDQPMKG